MSIKTIFSVHSRIAKGEVEYQAAIDRINEIKLSHDKFHVLNRTAMQKENEVDQLKKALSDSQLSIFEERKHVLRLISENDELKSIICS